MPVQTNNRSSNVSVHQMNEMDGPMMLIPEPIRRWMANDAGTPFNPLNILEAHRNGTPWSEIWKHLIAYSQREHHSFDWPKPPAPLELRRNDPLLSASISAMQLSEKKLPTLNDWWFNKDL